MSTVVNSSCIGVVELNEGTDCVGDSQDSLITEEDVITILTE